ncbi:MAG: VOC family protein, partial [Cytophagales bacterium]|nr:VOC family protein [Cytophagales bacterium]
MQASGKNSTHILGWMALVVAFSFGFTDEPEHAPLTLDYIHYHVNDAQAARKFFIGHFQAHPLAKPDKNPLPFVEYLEVRPGQASIAISPRGPFPGLNMQDPARWRRTPIRMDANTPPAYGVHWLALRTENLKLALQSLDRQGVKIAAAEAQVPGEPHAKAAVVWGPEFTRILIIQRGGEKKQETLYGIDHLLILVEDLPENVRF